MLPVTLGTFEATPEKQRLLRLTKSRLKLLEETTVLSSGEKVELLLIFLRKKWIAEVDIGLERKEASLDVLKQLGLPSYIESYSGSYVEHWIQVGANQAVLDYVRSRRNELSDLESGILYGFPLTHVLGFVGIVSKRIAPPADVALFMLAGTYSSDFYEDEVRHFRRTWKEIEKISPKIAKEAWERYESYVEDRRRG